MRSLKKIFFVFGLCMPLLGHAQGFFGSPPSCDDRYAACLAEVVRIQTRMQRLINVFGLNMTDHFSSMRSNCGKTRLNCIARENLEREAMIEWERSLTPEQRAAREASLKEFEEKLRAIYESANKKREEVDKMMRPDFNKIDLRRSDELLKEHPGQWWLEQERRRNALRSPYLPS